MSETKDIKVLELLRVATCNGMMEWTQSGDDLFHSALGQDEFKIEIIYLQRSREDSCEKALIRIESRNIYQTYAIGTNGYERILDILQLCVHGWQEGSDSYQRKLGNLQARLEKQIAEQVGAPNDR